VVRGVRTLGRTAIAHNPLTIAAAVTPQPGSLLRRRAARTTCRATRAAGAGVGAFLSIIFVLRMVRETRGIELEDMRG